MKRYPKYKESSAEWIGEIPAHWEMINTKYLFRLVTEPAPQNNDYELLSIYTNIGVKPRKELEERGNRATTTDGYWLVKKGDFIVNKLLAWMGAIGLSDYEGVTSPAYDILRKVQPLNERFYEYLFRCGLYFTEFKKWSKGIMEVRLRLYFDQFGQIPLVFPPVDDQNKIVDFLDHKTGQIDELIRIKERRIELLHEQRTALINQAVTKGLDPNVEMKPSGVEWIGQIPKHWTVTRLKYISNIPVTYGLNIESDKYTTEGFRLIRITDIDGHGSLRQKGVYLSEDCVPQEQILNSYDLLLSRSGATVGKSYLHLEDGKYTSAGYLVRFNFGDYYASKFIYYVTLSHFYRNWLEQQIIISTIQNVNGEKYSNFQIPISSHQEQTQIVNFLDCKTERIDALISTEQRKIDLLKEYRQSLISEAVTGKIDVRNEV